jgi:hypothetical protein
MMASLFCAPRRVAVLALLAMACSAPAALACPQQLPKGLSAAAVADDVVVDGLAVSILQVRGRESAAALLERLEKEWQDAGFAVRRNNAAGWSVLAALSDKCLTTLQLVDRGGAFGYLAMNGLGKVLHARTAARLPLPPGATELSRVVSNDDGRHATTLALTSSQSIDSLNVFYMQRLNDEGWQGVHAQVTLDRNRAVAAAVVSGQRGRERIEVVLWRDGVTHAVVNLAEAL